MPHKTDRIPCKASTEAERAGISPKKGPSPSVAGVGEKWRFVAGWALAIVAWPAAMLYLASLLARCAV